MISVQVKKTNIDMQKIINNAKRKEVVVGLPAGKADAQYNGLSVIDLGIIHEFGAPTKGIPQRSFLRSPILTAEQRIRKTINTEFTQVLSSKQLPETGLNRIGAFATGISQKAFATQNDGQWTPIKTSTIKAKGSSKALIDSGQLRQSITWAVRDVT